MEVVRRFFLDGFVGERVEEVDEVEGFCDETEECGVTSRVWTVIAG